MGLKLKEGVEGEKINVTGEVQIAVFEIIFHNRLRLKFLFGSEGWGNKQKNSLILFGQSVFKIKTVRNVRSDLKMLFYRIFRSDLTFLKL